MHRVTFNLSALLLLVGISYQSFGLEFEKVKVITWRRGETIAAEDFIAANEAVADFLATLPRPSDPMKGLRFECLIKSRRIRPSVQQVGGSQPYNSYVTINTVYDIKNCTPLD